MLKRNELNTIRFTYNSEHLHTVREEMKEERERAQKISPFQFYACFPIADKRWRRWQRIKEEEKNFFVDVKKKNHFMAYDRSNFITQKWEKEGFMYIKFYIFIE